MLAIARTLRPGKRGPMPTGRPPHIAGDPATPGVVHRAASHRHRTIGVALLVVLAVGVPVAGAAAIAFRMASDAARSVAAGYAREVLQRSDATVDEVQAAFARMSSVAAPCSAAGLEVMRAIDIASPYIQAVGHAVGSHMTCSSIGAGHGSVDLGPVSTTTPTGVKVRIADHLSLAPATSVMVLQTDGNVALINEQLPVDIGPAATGTSLATILLPSGRIVARRGHPEARWLGGAQRGQEQSFISAGTAVATIGSQRHFLAAVADVPPPALLNRQRSMLLRLIPIGLAVGLLLSAAILAAARRRLNVTEEFRIALRRREFYLDYQPVIELRTGTITGAEALLRWNRPAALPARPDIFFPVAEEAGVMRDLTRRMIELVGDEMDELLAAHPDFHLSVNLAAADLEDPDTVDDLITLRNRIHARPGQLIAEITERSLLNTMTARPHIEALRAAGIAVAIDDFGTGYSSLSYLQTIELDYLKIDKSFVDTINTRASTGHVVNHVIEIARELGLSVIAEGVENPAQADYLRDRGVAQAQGWLYSRPISAANLHRVVAGEANGTDLIPLQRGPDRPSRLDSSDVEENLADRVAVSDVAERVDHMVEAEPGTDVRRGLP